MGNRSEKGQSPLWLWGCGPRANPVGSPAAAERPDTTLAPDAQWTPPPRGSPTSRVRPQGTPPHFSVSRHRSPPGPVAGGPGYTQGRVVLHEVRLCVNFSSIICELSDLGQMILLVLQVPSRIVVRAECDKLYKAPMWCLAHTRL